MKLRKFILVAGLLILLINLSAIEKAPEFKLKNMKGKWVNLSQKIDKHFVILDFWASFCGPCKKELPGLNKIDKNHKDINVLAVCTDRPRTQNKAKAFIKSNRFSFETLFDSKGTVRKLFNVVDIPHTVIIAPNGEIVTVHTGYKRGDEKHLLEAIEKWKKAHK